MTKNEFINLMYRNSPAMPGLYVSVMIAQSALESGWGGSELTKKYNNYFGILADSSWKGAKVKFTNGFTYRVYNNVRESIKDYVKFLTENGRYKKAGVFYASTPEEEAKALQKAKYAGNSTTYADKIITIINQNDLKQYDKKKRRKRILIISILAGFIIIKLGRLKN